MLYHVLISVSIQCSLCRVSFVRFLHKTRVCFETLIICRVFVIKSLILLAAQKYDPSKNFSISNHIMILNLRLV